MRSIPRGLWRGIFCVFLTGLSLRSIPAWCLEGPIGDFDSSHYGVTAATTSWAAGPSDHHRIFLDIYNVADFFDSETAGTAGFIDQTLFADTIRPTVTVLWDERFRIQLGMIAERLFGDPVGFSKVDPWIQLLWKPTTAFNVILGNLDTPHYYHPALFYPTNYFVHENKEEGVQLIFDRPAWYDDLYFNYRELDTVEHNEKFDLGFVHHNEWKWLHFSYQAHWIHQGGELNPHPVNTVNDVAQSIGIGVHGRPFSSPAILLGASYAHLHSRQRQDATDPALRFTNNGGGDMFEAFMRWSRVKLIVNDWRGHGFNHEGGDPMYTLPVLDTLTLRWDILNSRDFNLFGETTGYLVGSNSQGYKHDVKAAFWLQASWQFSVPIFEWTSPAASSEGQPRPARWDYGI
jgi:hypothetical protein